MSLLNRRLNRLTYRYFHVIPAKAGIQCFQLLFWIPALRYAPAGMTYLFDGLIIIPALNGENTFRGFCSDPG